MKSKTSYHSSSWTTAQWIIFIIALIALLLLTMGLKAQNSTFDHTLVDKLAKDYVGLKQNRALVIGIIKNGEKTIFTYGETKKGNKTLPDKESVFELGQLSEVFTASLMAVLESEGKLSSQEAVSDIMKDVLKVPFYQRVVCQKYPTETKPNGEPRPPVNICFPDPNDVPQLMVLCDLATHSAGLPEEPNVGLFARKRPYSGYTTIKLNKYISSLPPNQSFGFEYQHSALGMALLGEVLSYKMKTDYPTLLKTTLLDPLSMANTFIVPGVTQTKLLLEGHSSKGKILPHNDYNALTPAYGIRSNVPDLLTFLEANLSVKHPLNMALSESHLARLYTDMRHPDYMVGWSWIQSPLDDKDPKNKKKMLWQAGERGGFAGFLAMVKDSGTAIVVLSNSANAVDNLGQEILKSLEKAVDKIKTVSVD